MHDKVIVEHRNKQENIVFEYTNASVDFTGDFALITIFRQPNQIASAQRVETVWFKLNDIKSIKYTN